MRKISLLFTILLFTVHLIFAAVQDGKKGIEFRYEAPEATEVFLTGSFNDWDTTRNPMEKNKDGIWETTLKLSAGHYQYKYVVDGVWNFDQDNPLSEDDGYGGANSVIDVDEKGKLLIKSDKSAISSGIKASFNPKIFFTGRYYVQNYFQRTEHRFMLDKPEHDINLGVKVKFNPNFEGFTLWNINNNRESTDMWKTHLNYKRAYLKLNTNLFSLFAFDDFGFITSSDPLHILGDEGKYHYKFGYGYRGISFKSEDFLTKFTGELPFFLNLRLVYADKLGDNERDIDFSGLKIGRYFEEKDMKIMFGSSLYNSRNKLNDSWIITQNAISDTIPVRLSQKNEAYEFDVNVIKEIMRDHWDNPLKVSMALEYLGFTNSNNFQNIEIESTLDTLITEKTYNWMKGNNILLSSELSFPAALKLYFTYLISDLEFNLVSNGNDIPYIDADFNQKELNRQEIFFKADFSDKKLSASIGITYQTTEFPDTLVSWNDYFTYVEKTKGNGRWYQENSDFTFERLSVLGTDKNTIWQTNLKYKFRFLKHDLCVGLANNFAQYGFFNSPRFIENVFCTKIEVSPRWSVYTSTRLPIYNLKSADLVTDFKADKDVFLSNYSEISYHLKKNIYLSLGWGVNPRTLNNVTDEFYQGGREEYMDGSVGLYDYAGKTYNGLGNKIRAAEKALSSEQRISIEAVINF